MCFSIYLHLWAIKSVSLWETPFKLLIISSILLTLRMQHGQCGDKESASKSELIYTVISLTVTIQ